MAECILFNQLRAPAQGVSVACRFNAAGPAGAGLLEAETGKLQTKKIAI